MTIIRIAKRETPYAIIDKTFLEDNRISFKAKGILAYLLSKPDDWIIMLKDLAAQSKEGRDACASAIHELEECGYVERKKLKKENGHFDGWETVIYERPRTDNPISDNPPPKTDYPDSGNPTLISNEYNNKNKATYVALQKGKKKPFPKDFEVTQEHIEYARKKNLPSPVDEFDKFKEYHVANGSIFSNWNYALYKWLRNAKEFKESRHATSRRNFESSNRRTKVDIFESATAGAFKPRPPTS